MNYKNYTKEKNGINPLLIEQELKEYFAQKLTEDLYTPKEYMKLNECDLPDELKGIGTSIYDAGTEFRMLTNTKQAIYNEKSPSYTGPIRDSLEKRRFFCTCYTRNDMMRTIKYVNEWPQYSGKDAICFGYNNPLMFKQITHMSPRDIGSGYGDYEEEKYLLPDTLIDETCKQGYGYNEIGFKGPIIPDYIVIGTQGGKLDTDVNILKKVLEEYENKIPIVLIDVDKCLESESKKIESMISRFERTNSPEHMSLIIQKIRHNWSTALSFKQRFYGIEKLEDFENLENRFKKILNFRKNLKWQCKGQSLLSTSDLENECISLELNFKDELKRATGKVNFESELDKHVFLKDDANEINIPEDKIALLQQKAKELGLDFEEECDNAIARKMFRYDLKKYYRGQNNKDMTIEILHEQCESLGLCWNYEMNEIYHNEDEIVPIADTFRAGIEKVAIGEMARNVQGLQTELAENYKGKEGVTLNKGEAK